MNTASKKDIFLKFKNKLAGHTEIQITKQKLTETRIKKDNDLIYENSPSREIRKWFEIREI